MRRILRILILVTVLGNTVGTGGPSATQAAVATPACTLGETRNPNTTIFSFNEPQYSVFQLVNPSSCVNCTAGFAEIQSATWRLRFFAFCTVTVEISIVGAADGACPYPDTTEVLCPPTIFQYTPTTISSGQNVVFPMSAGCCISRPAFVRLKMLDTGACASNQFIPFHVATPDPACTTCSSYTLPPGEPLQDSCVFPGAIHAISVQSECCTPTSTVSRSWGRIKTIYR